MNLEVFLFLFKVFSAYSAFFLLIYVLGRVFTAFIPESSTRSLNVFLVGSFSVILLTSMYFTRLKTSMLLFVPFLLWIFFLLKTKGNKNHFSAINLSFWQIILAPITCFLFFFLNTISFKAFPFFNSGRDHIFYARASQLISEYGIENIKLDWLWSDAEVGVTPYHYIEIWLNSFLHSTTGLLSIQTFEFLTVPILFSLLYWAFFAFARSFLSSRYATLVSLLVIIIPPMAFNPEDLRTTTLFLPKVVPALILALFILDLLKNKSWLTSLSCFLIFPLVNMTLLPFAFWGYSVCWVWMIWSGKLTKGQRYMPLWIGLMWFLMVVGFYLTFTGNVKLDTGLSLDFLAKYYSSNPENVKKAIHFFLNYLSWPVRYYAVLWVPVLVYVLVTRTWKNIIVRTFLFGLVMMLLLSVSASIIHAFDESSQLVYNFLIPFSSLLIYLTLIDFIRVKIVEFRILSGLFIGSFLVFGAILWNRMNWNATTEDLVPEFAELEPTVQKELLTGNPKNKLVLRYLNQSQINYAYDLYNSVQPYGYFLYYLHDEWRLFTNNHHELELKNVAGFPKEQFQMAIESNYLDFLKFNRPILYRQKVEEMGWVLDYRSGKVHFSSTDRNTN